MPHKKNDSNKESLTPYSKLVELNGVGAKTNEILKSLGLNLVGDMLINVPRKYDDYSKIQECASITPGKATVRVKIDNVKSRYAKKGLHITEAVVSDNSGKLRSVWFSQPYRAASLPLDTEVYMSGEYGKVGNSYVLNNPTVELVSNFTKNTARLVPVYSASSKIPSRYIRKYISQILSEIKLPKDYLSKELLSSNNLQGLRESLKAVHFPRTIEEAQMARRRLAFEELHGLILAQLSYRAALEDNEAFRIKFLEEVARKYTENLPFQLTSEQKKAAWQILQDIDRSNPMNRLLQGDTGSGKTAVAIMSLLMCAMNGYQGVIMAPTEVLAQQHLQTANKLLKKFNLDIELITGSTKASEKNRILEQVSKGKVHILIGTHSLLEESVSFENLALIVVDEQHRFGVRQRQKLIGKSKIVPHMLSLSATPIPRSLALTVYGELQITTLNELPPGRIPVATSVVHESDRESVYKHIDIEIEKGRQVFLVCPMIEESDITGVRSVTEEYERLSKSIFAHRSIGLLHGRLSPKEKSAVLEAYRKGTIDILVSTTVIEVGVDIPNATILMVEGAERFGLAQLHQLRGRVGRNDKQSYCYLFTTAPLQARERLGYMEKLTSGFDLAEVDLQLRGPGQISGTRQHGELDLRIASITDTDLISIAQKIAHNFLESGEKIKKYPWLEFMVKQQRTSSHLN